MLKRLRYDNGLSLRELANEVGVSAAMLSRYETGESQMSAKAARRLGDFFDVPPSVVAGVAGAEDYFEPLDAADGDAASS